MSYNKQLFIDLILKYEKERNNTPKWRIFRRLALKEGIIFCNKLLIEFNNKL